MSAKDRAQKRAEADERRFVQSAMNGVRQALNSPDGRAFLWFFYGDNIDAEGPGGKGRRAVAREIMKACRAADFEMLQIMREEWEKPKHSPATEQDDGDDYST